MLLFLSLLALSAHAGIQVSEATSYSVDSIDCNDEDDDDTNDCTLAQRRKKRLLQRVTHSPLTDSEIDPFPPLGWHGTTLLTGMAGSDEVVGWQGSTLADAIDDPMVDEALHIVGTAGERFGTALSAQEGALLVGAPGSGRVYLFIDEANATDQAAATLQGAAGSGSEVALGDFDGDGQLDAAVSNSENAITYLVFGPLVGELDLESGLTFTGGGDLAVGDWNGDGLADLAVASVNGPVDIYAGGSLQLTAHLETAAGSIAFADTDGDGSDDLAVGIASWDAVDIYRGGDNADDWADQYFWGDWWSGTGTSVHGDDQGGLWITSPDSGGSMSYVAAGSESGHLAEVAAQTLYADGEFSLNTAFAADIDGNGVLDMVSGAGLETTVLYRY